MTATLDELLRECRIEYGHIQLFRDADGWQASVYHYEPQRLTYHGKPLEDPVDALRKALLEDERLTRDLERKYAAAPKQGDATADSDDFEDIFG